jgi:hypothetical protein
VIDDELEPQQPAGGGDPVPAVAPCTHELS